MIDIAWSQFLIILLLAVILLGPKELPLVLRTMGRWFVILRSHVQDLQDYVKAVSQIDPESPPGSNLSHLPLKPEPETLHVHHPPKTMKDHD